MKDYVAYFMVTKDDFCLTEACESLAKQGVRRFFFSVPAFYWDGTKTPQEDINDIENLVSRLASIGLCATLSVYSQVHAENLPMASVEARCRNDALRQMRSLGCGKHVLVVDGDELWRPDTLETLNKVVERGQPDAVTVGALSIVGCPGYPVSDHQEGLLVYVRNTGAVKFTFGRSTAPIPFPIQIRGIYHFTSTRRTMEETIDKHLKSCHYDDPQYDFDTWIKEKLPNLKPGERDCHMFKGWQVWSEIRHFTQQEWEEIPRHLHKFLGEPV
jgi:hypothetical protein